jgi:hypothetical protein
MSALRKGIGTGAAALCLWASSGAVALDRTAQHVGPEDGSKVVFSFSHAGLPAFMPGEKDRAFAEALALFPVRWEEVSREIPGLEPPIASLINTAIVTLARPTRLAIVSNPQNPDGGAFGYGLIASIEVADKADAGRLDAIVTALMSQAELPSPIVESERFEGMSEFEIPQGGLAAFGPRESDSGWHYEFLIGSVGDPDSFFETDEGDDDFTQVMHMRFDAGGLDSLMQFAPMFAQGNEQAMEGIQQLQELDLTGDNAFAIDVNMGYTDDESIVYTIVENADKLSELTYMPEGSLSRKDIDVVPADAEFAWVGRGDFSYITKALDDMAEQGVDVDAALEKFESVTGVDPVADILDALGGTMAAYTSDTTGGSTLLSGVMMISFKDRERFVGAMDRLVEIGNLAASGLDLPVSSASIELSRWSHKGTDLLSLRFPGLPVPLELSAALSDEWLILGATPQAVIAASMQATGAGGDGLSHNKQFTSALRRGTEFVSVSFVSPDRLIGEGYPFVSMFGSGLANLMRSPTQPDRVAPMLVPIFHELADGARAQVEFSYWDGSNFVTETHGDRSMLVNTAVMAGGVSRIMPLILGVGAAVGIANSQSMGMIDMDQPIASLMPNLLSPARPIALPQQVAIALSLFADRSLSTDKNPWTAIGSER